MAPLMITRMARDTRGTALIEFALTLPVTLLLIVGGFDINLATLAETKLTFNTNFAAASEASTPGTGWTVILGVFLIWSAIAFSISGLPFNVPRTPLLKNASWV